MAAEGRLSVPEARLTYACLDEDPVCWAQVGGALNVDLLVVGAVDLAADGVAVTLLLYDVQAVTLVDRMEDVFPRERLDRSVAEASRALLAPAVQPNPPPTAVSPPLAGASVPSAGASAGGAGAESARAIPQGGGRATPAFEPGAGVRSHASRPSSRRFLGWGILGAGATLAGVGLLFGLLAQDAGTEFELSETPERRAHELKDQGERYAAVANALYGVGAALAVTGAVLLVATPSDDEGDVAVVPHLSADGSGGGVSLGAAF